MPAHSHVDYHTIKYFLCDAGFCVIVVRFVKKCRRYDVTTVVRFIEIMVHVFFFLMDSSDRTKRTFFTGAFVRRSVCRVT